MNVQQEGLGSCTKCGTPIMQTIRQPGMKGICFGCAEDGKPKTGKTVVIKSETGEGTALGKVTLEQVEHNPGESSALPKDPEGLRKSIMDKASAKGVATPVTVHPVDLPISEGTIRIEFTVQDLTDNGIVNSLLQLAYDAIDNMPPFKTLKETKKAIKLQEDIEAILKSQEK